VSIVSLTVDQTCNECHGELGTLATGGLHPQQLLGNTCDNPYLSSGHSQALHACHTLPGSSVCLLGKLLPNFDLKNMILTYSKDFSWGKWPKFAIF
jgi:hypothetical protein